MFWNRKSTSNRSKSIADRPRFIHDCVNPGHCTFVGRTLRCDVYVTRGNDWVFMRHDDDEFTGYRGYSGEKARLTARDDAEVFHAVQLAKAAGYTLNG